MDRDEMVRGNREKTAKLRKKYSKRLEAVQDLKRQYYTGTKNILDYSTTYENLENRVKSFVDEVNSSFSDNGEFLATPKRIFSVLDMLGRFIQLSMDYLVSHKEGEGLDNNSAEDAVHSLFSRHERVLHLTGIDGIELFGGTDGELYSPTVELIRDAFKEIVNQKDCNDHNYLKHFGDYFLGYIHKSIEGDEALSPYFGHFSTANAIIKESNSFEEINNEYEKNKKEALSMSKVHSVGAGDVLKRVIRDQVDHKTEYRRQVMLLMYENYKIFKHDLLGIEEMGETNNSSEALGGLIGYIHMLPWKGKEMEKKTILGMLRTERKWLRKVLTK